MAQLVEHWPRNLVVTGSNPVQDSSSLLQALCVTVQCVHVYCVQADLSGGEHGQWKVYQREQRPRHPNSGQTLLPPRRYCTCTHTHMHACLQLELCTCTCTPTASTCTCTCTPTARALHMYMYMYIDAHVHVHLQSLNYL